ncbi:MAG: hypothetical protein ACI4F5_06290 [Acutalibacteraceae bacterium]
MQNFYFTYGLEGQPFKGGWSIVSAPDLNTAIAAFQLFHPNKNGNCLNCADYYTEEQFKSTQMWKCGNLGAELHEVISITRWCAE